MGLLDQLGNLSPEQTQGLLGAASAMLQQSGPSLMPHSFGQVLGAGLTGGTNAFNSATQLSLDRRKEAMQMAMLQQQVAQATRKNDLTNRFLEQAMGGGQPGAGGMQMPAGAPPDTAVGFTPPVQAPGGQGSGGFGGVPNSAIAADLAFNNGSKIGEWVNDRTKPTDFARQLQQAGIDPNSPLGRQAMQNQVAKQNYVAPVNARPGSIVRDPFNQQPLAFNPHIPEGGTPTFDASGNVVGINSLPGAAGVTEGMSRASAAGKASVTPVAGVDGNGNPIFTNQLTAAGGAPAPNGIAGLNNMSPEQRAQVMSQARAQFGLQPGPTPGSSAVRPAAPPGYAESQSALATAGAGRYLDLVKQASDSPTRVNVYDNILNLSKEGVQSGPGQAWMNKVKGYVGNAPLLGSVAGKWKDDVAGAQELNKFMYQNAIRNWQAAGGTGTDSQMAAASNANPNDTMFPKALQKMAEWGKAGELALQGKANAAQQWKDAQGGNVVNQDQFERTWRNNFDPMLYQLRTMDPQEAAATVANLKKTNPSAYSTLMLKATALKNIGGL